MGRQNLSSAWKLRGSAAALAILMIRAPEGWEDEAGFHYGRREDLGNKTVDQLILGKTETSKLVIECADQEPVSEREAA